MRASSPARTSPSRVQSASCRGLSAIPSAGLSHPASRDIHMRSAQSRCEKVARIEPKKAPRSASRVSGSSASAASSIERFCQAL